MKTFRIIAAGIACASMASPARGQSGGVSPKEWAEKLVSVSSVLGPDGPQWMPDGSRILFPSTLGGNSACWSVAPEGGPPARVTRDVAPQITRVARRGQWIADL